MRRSFAVLVVLIALAAGCADDGGSDTADSPGTTDPQATNTTAETTTDAAETTTTAPPPAAVPTEFDLLTYNVAGLPDVLSGSEPAVNTELIGPGLNDYELVLVQESWLTPEGTSEDLRTFHEILVEFAEHEYVSESLPAPNGTDLDRPSALLSDGLNRFSDFPFEPVERSRWTTCGEASADCLSLKGFSVARTTFGDGIGVDVYNLHLDAGREDADVRGENVAELVAFITEFSADMPIIVGGDFNLHLDRDPDADQFAQLLAETGLTDVCTELACAEPNRIDKILVRSTDDVIITALEWRNESAAFTRDDGEPLSDHDPVVARLEIRGT